MRYPQIMLALLALFLFAGCSSGGGGSSVDTPDVPTGTPDFGIELLASDGVVLAGEDGELIVRITNHGDAAAQAAIEVSVPGSGVITTDDTGLMAAGDATDFTYGLTFTVEGSITIMVTVDPGDAVDESNESNNQTTAVFTVIGSAST